MSIFDYAIKVMVVTFVVLGLMLAVIGLSGVDMGNLDEHEVFRYRLVAAPVAIVGYLLMDYLVSRRRARLAAIAASTGSQDRPRRGYAAEFISLAALAAGGAAFWHDHVTHEIPNAVAVAGTFVSAKCVASGKRTGPHMGISYEFPSQSTSARAPQTQCLLTECEPEKMTPQFMDTAYRTVFYATLQECTAALPAVLASKAPTTVWTGDKDFNAAVRARFTPERDTPPYFLIWVPLAVAALVLLVSIVQRTRRPRED
ncbi:hypothetical protein [Ramlibacter sp. WS9]|uniref:hypothetical protein n=1 Tax=Ramlibacter sp. WS9 TaxID=1882741 RepID=UPI001141DF17|nr:hypothetical protein [Ramlibacter sp. WS9]ROZ76528.1 hypothetical protein EEB15_11780 [Ramlibacter sp. WS9]